MFTRNDNEDNEEELRESVLTFNNAEVLISFLKSVYFSLIAQLEVYYKL